jgi:hypothetical protein
VPATNINVVPAQAGTAGEFVDGKAKSEQGSAVNKFGKFVVLAALALVIYSAWTVYQGAQGFNPPAIEDVKKRIQDDFTAKKFTVTEISMLRRGPRELAGFVKLKAQGSDEIQQRNCTATMAEDKVTTSWSCE